MVSISILSWFMFGCLVLMLGVILYIISYTYIYYILLYYILLFLYYYLILYSSLLPFLCSLLPHLPILFWSILPFHLSLFPSPSSFPFPSIKGIHLSLLLFIYKRNPISQSPFHSKPVGTYIFLYYTLQFQYSIHLIPIIPGIVITVFP